MDTPQPSRHERRRLQTRKQLIETTMQLVLEKGYDAISIQDITDRADLGRGTFYIHFKDKEEIVWIVFQELFRTLEQDAHKQLDRNAPPPTDVDFNIPSEIEAQILTGTISRLLFWWLETTNDYSAEQMATMIYQVLYRKNPPP